MTTPPPATSREQRTALRHSKFIIQNSKLNPPLSQVGPEFVILRHPEPVPAGPVEIVVTVDGRVHRRRATVSADTNPSAHHRIPITMG